MSDLRLGEFDRPLPVGSAGRRSGGWWGMLALILTEAALFGYLIFSYLYLASQNWSAWPPDGKPELLLSGANTLILLSSSFFVWACEKCVRRRRKWLGAGSMGIGIVLGVVFVGIQFHEWHDKPYGLTTNLYGSLYFTMTGLHMAHVVVGLVVLSLLLIWTALGYFDEKRCAALQIGALYWHFVDVVWLFLFSTLFLSPYLS